MLDFMTISKSFVATKSKTPKVYKNKKLTNPSYG